MKEIAEFIVGLFKDLKLSSKMMAVVFLILLSFFCFIGYEKVSGHFYLAKLEKKISMLIDLQNISQKGFEDSPELIPIYTSLVNEVVSYGTSNPSFPILDKVLAGKAISGAIIWLVVIIIGVSSDFQKNRTISGNTIGVVIMVGIVAILFGWLGTKIPTLGNPWVNYILFPFVQIVCLFVLLGFSLCVFLYKQIDRINRTAAHIAITLVRPLCVVMY